MPNFKKNPSPAMKRSGFKMKGWSPFHQDKKAKVTPQKTEEKFRLLAGQQVKGGPRDYFKLYSDGKKVKISEATYNSLKGQ